MAKQQKNQIDNLYNFSNNKYSKIQEKEEKKKIKERQKRIKQRKDEQKNQFDIDTETVIGMTNKNNQKKKEETQKRITKKQANILRKKKKIKRIVKFITLILLIAGGMTFALVSPIFNIKEIQVINNKQIATETIISLSQLQEGQNIFRFNRNKVEKEIIKKQYSKCSLSESELGGLYLRNLRIQLFSYMKDICIQFLGYDALERFNAISLAEIAIPDKNEEYNFDFLGNPRIITTACFNPNEKYFNWQIMDYQIQNVPKYNYNTLTRTFEEVPDISTFHQRHSEEIYGQEIACIKISA